jgi:hypothetical protein
VLNKATLDDPVERHQSIDEFWEDLGELRRFAADFETATAVRPKFHAAPQANVMRGYSPLAPQQPRFNTSRDLKVKDAFLPAQSPLRIDVEKLPKTPAIQSRPTQPIEDHWPEQIQEQQKNVLNTIINEDLEEIRKKNRRKTRRLTAFAVVLLMFVGGLYATSVFVQRSGVFDSISASSTAKTGRANTDINLRPSPSADNEPIGLVTKNSKVRVLKVQNNWYQVDIIEQGRERDVGSSTNRGWLHGRYVDLD